LSRSAAFDTRPAQPRAGFWRSGGGSRVSTTTTKFRSAGFTFLRGDPFPGALAPDQNPVSKSHNGEAAWSPRPAHHRPWMSTDFFGKRLKVDVVGEKMSCFR
jgi:hypothetical protein